MLQQKSINPVVRKVCARVKEREDDCALFWATADWDAAAPLANAMLLLALAVWKCRCPSYIPVSPLSVSHTRRHMGRPVVCVCLGKAKSCWKSLCTCDSVDLYCADFSLYWTCSQHWGSRSVIFYSIALALSVPHWNRARVSLCSVKGR